MNLYADVIGSNVTQQNTNHLAMDSETGIIAIDQGGEWGKRRSTCLGGRLAL